MIHPDYHLDCVWRDPLVLLYPLAQLIHGGIINCFPKRPIELVEPELHVPGIDLGIDPSDYPTSIHPVFRYEQFLNLDKNDYDNLLAPVLRLATCLLVDVNILPFFNDLINRGPVPLNDYWAEKTFSQPLYQIGTNNSPMTNEEYKKTWRTLANMRHHLRWNFKDPSKRCYMATDPLPQERGAVSYPTQESYKSMIYIKEQYLNILRGTEGSQHLLWAQPFNRDDAVLRTAVHMAMTMCHELCHATKLAHYTVEKGAFDLDSSGAFKNMPLPAEPFYRDHNISELGMAYQHVIFGGSLHPIGDTPDADVIFPCGSKMVDFEGTRMYTSDYLRYEKTSPLALGITTNVERAVEMSYHQDMFAKILWQKAVPMRGLSALKIPYNLYSIHVNVAPDIK